MTALQIAINMNAVEIVKLLLLSKNININEIGILNIIVFNENIDRIFSDEEITALTLATKNNRFDFVKLLLSQPKIDVNTTVIEKNANIPKYLSFLVTFHIFMIYFIFIYFV